MTLSAWWLTLIPLFAGPMAHAQRATPASIGPGRIVCNATFCELSVGEARKRRVRVIASRLPEVDTRRLRKCTGVSTPCVVTVDGIEQGDPMKILATRVVWQD
jgi:hypothetical protein